MGYYLLLVLEDFLWHLRADVVDAAWRVDHVLRTDQFF